MDDLKTKANPLTGLSSTLAYEIKELRKEQVITNNLLVALCDSNDLIVTYKEQQKQGDKRSRKRSELYSKVGIGIALIGTVIALVAVYISITGLDGRVARFFTGLIGGL
jgi:hypothetical protein